MGLTYAKECKIQRLRNCEVHVSPLRVIVAAPVASIFAAARECRSTDDEWTLAWENCEYGIVCRIQDLMSEEIVDIILLNAIVMCGIRRDRVDRKITLDIVDHVRWMIDIADARCWRRSKIRYH